MATVPAIKQVDTEKRPYSINTRSHVAVYLQIEQQILFKVASGQLKPGDQLPSVKSGADSIEVNFNTIAKAYRDLEVMGVMYTRRGMGCFVAKEGTAIAKAKVAAYIGPRLQEAVREAKASGMTLQVVIETVRKAFASDAPVY